MLSVGILSNNLNTSKVAHFVLEMCTFGFGNYTFVPAFDNYDDVRIGWLKTNVKKATTYKDDGRFSE
jgi:hypothetical protein